MTTNQQGTDLSYIVANSSADYYNNKPNWDNYPYDSTTGAFATQSGSGFYPYGDGSIVDSWVVLDVVKGYDGDDGHVELTGFDYKPPVSYLEASVASDGTVEYATKTCANYTVVREETPTT